MANYETLKTAIQQVVKTNGNNEITGALLQQSLLAMINSLGSGYQFAGIAVPATNPGNPDGRVFYIASHPGTYTNFAGAVLAQNEVAILKFDTAWTKITTNIGTASYSAGNALFNANVYLYGHGDYTHRLTLQEAINAARNAGVNDVARAITYFDTDGAKLAIFNSAEIYTGFPNPANWRVLDLGKIADAIYQYIRGAALTVLATNNGYYMATDGTLVANSEYRVVKYQITNETDIVVSGRSVLVGQLAIAFDSSNNIISSFEVGTALDYSDFHISVPTNTAYVCVTGYNNTGIYQPSAYSATLQKTFYTKDEADATFAKIENVGALINTALDSFKANNLIIGDEELITGGTEGTYYVNATQTIGSAIRFGKHSTHRVFENIPANSIVRINITTGGEYGFALTDQNDNVLEYCKNDRTEYTFAPHNQITKLYVSPPHFVNAYKIIPQELKQAVSDLMPRVTTLENIVGSLNYWYGKRIWWCGTSIPAGSDATLGSEETIAGNYPKQVGENLGATVNNEAVGGSMCRANVRTGDYTGANFSNITSALSMTREEIENFITNYDSIKGRLQGAPASLSNSDINRLRAASFETKLLPYLDGTKPMPDLFVIDHGHNDFKYTLAGGGSDIQLQPTVQNITDNILAADTYMTANNNAKLESFMGSLANIPSASKAEFIASLNRNCYIGAINFIVTLILRYNPKARIVFISNYEYENGANKQYAPLIPAQESIAKSWAFPLCRVYEFVGFSDHIIPNSMAWFNTTYPDVTPATSDVTVFRDYNPDNVHPHSDITGDANKIYAGVISEFIKQCR